MKNSTCSAPPCRARSSCSTPPSAKDEVWNQIPEAVQQQIIDKKIKFYTIDAYKVAGELGMGQRINTIMQTCFFAISGVLPREEAIASIKKSIKKTYGAKGDHIVQMNYQAVDQTLANLHQVEVPAMASSGIQLPPTVSAAAPEFVKKVTAEDHRRPRRQPAGQRLPDRRHVPLRHGAVGKAQYRP